jgi:hypothetical protein
LKLTRHRNLYNADSCTIFYTPELWQPEGGRYSTRAIERFVKTLAGGGVDTLLINPNTQVAWQPSKTMPTILDGYTRGDREFFRTGRFKSDETAKQKDIDAYLDNRVAFFNLYLDLAEDGVDWVAHLAGACRTRGINPWVSVRMNDTHGADDPSGSYMNSPLYKQHPEMRLSGRVPNPKDEPFVWCKGLNFAFAEVRDYMMRMIRDLVDDYDFDGIELDWTRHQPFFEMPVSADDIRTITDFMTGVRAMTEAKSKRAGRPFPLGVRVLNDLGKSKNFGIDVVALARAGMIDFVVASNFWQTSWDAPHDRLRAELGNDVTIYGVTETIPNWLNVPSARHPGVENLRFMASSASLLRANAAGKLALGADGIEQFNFFAADVQGRQYAESPTTAPERLIRSDYSALRGLGDLEQLRGTPKHYAFSTPTTAGWEPPHIEAVEQLPVTIAPNGRHAFRIPMCAEPSAASMSLVAQIIIDKPEHPVSLGVSFNGSWPTYEIRSTAALLMAIEPFTHHRPEHRAFNVTLNIAEIREGWNELVVHNGCCDQSLRIAGIEIAIAPDELMGGVR